MASLLDPAAATAPPVPTYSWAEHALPVTSLAVGGGPAGGAGGSGLVASASADRTCKLWTLGGGHLLRSVAFPAALACVALDACESTLYAGATDGRVFEVPLNAVASAGAGLESAGSGQVDGLSNRSAGFGAATLEGHARAVTAIACSADGERVTSSSEDGTCRVWDAASRQTTHVLRHPKGSPIVALAVAPRARVAGEGAGGAGERRKLAPLAPFSRFAGAGLSAAEGGLAGGKSGGSGRLEPWEGAPVVLRGVSACDRETAGVLGRDDALLGGSAPTRATCAATGSGGGGKRDRSDADGPAGEGDDAVAGLRERLAAAEADAAAAREETASWKKRHGELRAFVSEELVDRETKR
jgi:pre-rRNA-processing protein IPI3